MRVLSRTRQWTLACGALLLALGTSALAQEHRGDDASVSRQPQANGWASPGVGSPATLNASIARAVDRAMAVEAFRPIRFQAQTTPQRQQQPTRGWIRRHPMLFGALLGFGVGCPLGAAQVGGSQDDFFNGLDEWACPFLGGVGAAAGAGLGAALSR